MGKGTRNKFKISSEERDKLKALLRQGIEKARTLTRARILLMRSRGKSTEEVCQALEITDRTVRNVIERYEEGGIAAAIHEAPRSGAPRKIDGTSRAKITALACSNPPEGNSQWSLRLLADNVVELAFVEEISHTQVQRILKKTK